MADSNARPVLGRDITDLTPFGGAVTELLRNGLADDELHAPLIDWVLNDSKLSTETISAINERLALWREPLITERRPLLAAFFVLPIGASERLARITGFELPPSIESIVKFAGDSWFRLESGAAITVQDLVEAGTRWGWTIADIVTFMARVDVPSAIVRIEGRAGFAADHAQDLLAATTTQPSRAGLWTSLSGLSSDRLDAFVTSVIVDAVAKEKRLRDQAQHAALSLAPLAAAEELQTLIDATPPAQRLHASSTLLSIVSSADVPMPAVRHWIEQRTKAESSVRVLAVLEKVKAVLVDREAVPIILPEVHFEAFELTDEEWSTLAGSDDSWATADEVRDYLSVVRPVSYHETSRVLYSLQRVSGLHLDDRLGDANRVWLRLQLSGHNADYRASIGIDENLGADPLFISAVAQSGNVGVSSPLWVVPELWLADSGRWSPELLGGWLTHHSLDIVAMIEGPTHHFTNRNALLQLLFSVENRPASIDHALVRAAVLGSDSHDQILRVGIDERYTDDVLAYLDQGQNERIGAAEWIRSHPTREATDALHRAARFERDDRVKAAMLTSLEVLGVSLEEFLSPAALASQAADTMSKKASQSKAIDWLDTSTLPRLHWKNDDPVDNAVMLWFLHSAAKNKSAVPSPIVRRHFSNMNSGGVADFGVSLLEAWLQQDLERVTSADALKEAAMLAQGQHHNAQRYPAHFPKYAGLTVEQITGMLLPECETKFAGSARTSQGLLALVAASASPTAADLARTYVRKYRAKRASQSKALIEMLAWMDEPSAVQTVMSMANRFHPKSLQQEAARQIELLADHRGWSVEDLADRSVPDGGFDRHGRLTLDYGTRRFTAQLGDDLDITLVDDTTDTTIQSLPRGRADEDPDQIKTLKATLKEAKADVAAALDYQPQRLRRAMATERSWSSVEFARYVMEQPVMIRLASRLLWSTTTEGRDVIFRPLIDGTLLTMDDEELTLGDQPVRLAHGLRLEPESTQAAASHLADYEIGLLFSQLGRNPVEVAAGQQTLDVVAGAMLSANLLAARARSLGWQVADTNGTGASVGVFTRFTDLRLDAVLSVERGLHIGGYDYVDYECTLSNLYLVEAGSMQNAENVAVDLSELSPVLLAEVVNDALNIAGRSGA